MYTWLGYKGPFLLYGLIFLVFSILLKRILPSTVDLRVGETEDGAAPPKAEMQEKPIVEKDDEFIMDIDGEEQIKMNPSLNLDEDKIDATPRTPAST